MSAPLGLGAVEMRAACARFNTLDARLRSTFFALFVEGRGIESIARAEGVTVSEIGRRGRHAVVALLSPPEVERSDA